MSFRITGDRGCPKTLLSRTVVFALVLAVASVTAKAQPLYRITPIGNESLGINDLNDKGEVVGASTSEGTQRPILWRRGVLTRLPLLDDDPQTDASATSINERSDIVGYNSNEAREIYRGVIWRDGAVHDLNIPGGPVTFPSEINQFRVVAGSQCGTITCINVQGFVWYAGNTLVLPPLPEHVDGRTSVSGMNDRGVVFGSSRPAIGMPAVDRAVIWLGDYPVDLGSLPGMPTSASVIDVNNKFQVLGQSFAPEVPVRAWVWYRGRLQELPPLNAGTNPESHPMDINDRGEIVGMTRSFDNPTDPRATLWLDGSTYELSALVHPRDPWRAFVVLQSGAFINNKGQIVAVGRDSRIDGSGTQATAFLLTRVR